MSNFGRCLREYRRTHGMSQEQLASILGTSKQVISRYETGDRSPKISVAAEYAQKLGLTLAELNGEGPLDQNYDNITPVKRLRLPVRGTIAAGEPLYAEEEYDEFIVADEDYHADFALRVSGDSMEGAGIHDKDVVLIRQQDDVNNGQIAAVIIDDCATLKRVYHARNHITLVAENPKYEPMVFGANGETVRIIGLAVACISRLD